jgi:GntR family transcriptional regulator
MSIDVGLLDRDLAVPLYHQLQNLLKAEIESGRFRPDERLPSESELAKTFGISMVTVRQALQELVRLDYVRREQGRGTFVARRKFDEGPRELTSFTEEMRRHALSATSRVLAQFEAEADVRVAAALHQPAGSKVIVIKRLRLADKEPLALQTAHIPASLVPGLQLTATMSLYEVLQNEYHVHPSRARETYVAALADAATAALLEIPPGSPVYAVERVTLLPNDRPFEFVQSTVRGDRYSIVLDLVKSGGEQPALRLEGGLKPSKQL